MPPFRGCCSIEVKIQYQYIHTRFAEYPEKATFSVALHDSDTRASAIPRARATRGIWNRAASGLMCGSRPLPEVVTRSTGIGPSARCPPPSVGQRRVAHARGKAGFRRPEVRPARCTGVVRERPGG